MKVQRTSDAVMVELAPAELKWMRRALERASFIDTPPGEQAEIAAFCARALEALPRESV